jgi:hypothetical protein
MLLAALKGLIKSLTVKFFVESLKKVQTGSEVCPASYPVGTWNFSPVVRWLGHEANHSPPSTAEVKTAQIHTSTMSSWCST